MMGKRQAVPFRVVRAATGTACSAAAGVAWAVLPGVAVSTAVAFALPATVLLDAQNPQSEPASGPVCRSTSHSEQSGMRVPSG